MNDENKGPDREEFGKGIFKEFRHHLATNGNNQHVDQTLIPLGDYIRTSTIYPTVKYTANRPMQ